jgi:hypothetical protein
MIGLTPVIPVCTAAPLLRAFPAAFGADDASGPMPRRWLFTFDLEG